MKLGLRSGSGVLLTLAVHGLLLMGLLTGLRVKPALPQSRDMGVRLIAQAPPPHPPRAPSTVPRPTLPPVEPLHLTHMPVLMATEPAQALATEVQARPAVVPVVAATPSTKPEPSAQTEAITITAADHKHCPQPDYPSLLRSKRIEGLVLLRVRVEADGRPSDIVVQQGSGWRLLDEAAAQSARRCVFRPARRGQAEFASWVEYPVSFALRS